MDLEEFLVEAKINTYAKDGEGGEEKLKDGSKRLEYKKGSFYYRDTYFGFNPFAGEEIIFEKKKPIWVMNYHGRIVGKKILTKSIYNFLKKALSKVKANMPFRGPKNFKDKDFEYKNKVKGDVEKFVGQEQIFYKKKLIYSLDYHGGIIKK